MKEEIEKMKKNMPEEDKKRQKEKLVYFYEQQVENAKNAEVKRFTKRRRIPKRNK